MSKVKQDYAKKPYIVEDHETHWHGEAILVRKGLIAALALFVALTVLTTVTYAEQPVAAPKHTHKMAVSPMSLVDDKGGE